MSSKGSSAVATVPANLRIGMNQPRILIIEDERALTKVLTYNLEREGFAAIVAHELAPEVVDVSGDELGRVRPDLQGVWSTDDTSGIPMARPAQYSGLYMNDEQYAQRSKQVERGAMRGQG